MAAKWTAGVFQWSDQNLQRMRIPKSAPSPADPSRMPAVGVRTLWKPDLTTQNVLWAHFPSPLSSNLWFKCDWGKNSNSSQGEGFFPSFLLIQPNCKIFGGILSLASAWWHGNGFNFLSQLEDSLINTGWQANLSSPWQHTDLTKIPINTPRGRGKAMQFKSVQSLGFRFGVPPSGCLRCHSAPGMWDVQGVTSHNFCCKFPVLFCFFF